MTQWLSTIFVFLVLAMPTFGMQDARLDELDFEEATLKEEAIPYFAVGVGPVFSFTFSNLDDVNARAKELSVGEIKGPILQVGAEIFTAIGFIPNMRLGFSLMSGTVSGSANVNVGQTRVNRTVSYGVESRAFHIDYAFVPVKSLSILPGIGLGWGSHRIETYQSAESTSWKNFVDTSSFAPLPNAYTIVEQSAIYILPRLNVEYAVTPFLNLRAQAAYSLQVANGDWTLNRSAIVNDVPSGISMSGFSAQFGIFVGLFN